MLLKCVIVKMVKVGAREKRCISTSESLLPNKKVSLSNGSNIADETFKPFWNESTKEWSTNVMRHHHKPCGFELELVELNFQQKCIELLVYGKNY